MVFIKYFVGDITLEIENRQRIRKRLKTKKLEMSFPYSLSIYFLFLMKSHLQSYPCPLQINSFWNLGFLLAITIILQIITGIFLGLHYTSDLHSAYSSVFFFIREINYGWCLRYLHSSGASFVFHFLFLHFGRAISYGSYFYNPNIWFSGILHFFCGF